MADQLPKFIRYGDKELPLGDMTLDEAKAIMPRHFPELADPKVETKTLKDKIVYIFSKKAGHKGVDVGDEQGHREHHEVLHQYLDELVADWIACTGSLPSRAAIMELMTWSFEQTKNPTTPK